jgi:hypothetical protein
MNMFGVPKYTVNTGKIRETNFVDLRFEGSYQSSGTHEILHANGKVGR